MFYKRKKDLALTGNMQLQRKFHQKLMTWEGPAQQDLNQNLVLNWKIWDGLELHRQLWVMGKKVATFLQFSFLHPFFLFYWDAYIYIYIYKDSNNSQFPFNGIYNNVWTFFSQVIINRQFIKDLSPPILCF